MSTYINKGNDIFRSFFKREYVDKTGLIAEVNARLCTESRFMCVTRSRRFSFDRTTNTCFVPNQAMYQELLRKKDVLRQLWEEERNPSLHIDELDEDAIWRVVRAGVEAGRIPERMLHKEIPEILTTMHLTDGGQFKNAVTALFIKEMHAPIQMHLRMARFRGVTKRDFVDNRRATGNIFKLYDEGMAFFFKHLNISGTFVDEQPERIESLTIPYKALRECLLNALAHRIYSWPNSFVSIAVFDNRVEVENSGLLPNGLSLDDLMKPHSSHAQNPLIAQTMYFGKYLETWGRGIELMMEQCKEARIPSPKFYAEGGCFRVTFMRIDYIDENGRSKSELENNKVYNKGEQGVNDRGEQGMNELTDMEEKIIAAISMKPDISLAGIAHQLNLSRKNTHKHMASMQKRGIITRVGPSFGGIWKVILSPNSQTTNK